MGEIISGNFNNKEPGKGPQSPFKKPELIRAKFGGPSFSTNGVVEYIKGVRPKDDVDVLEKVMLHVGPMERTILSIFPNLKSVSVPLEMQEVMSSLSELNLVRHIEDSEVEDWVIDDEQALWYLGLINEVRKRDLDLEED